MGDVVENAPACCIDSDVVVTGGLPAAGLDIRVRLVKGKGDKGFKSTSLILEGPDAER